MQPHQLKFQKKAGRTVGRPRHPNREPELKTISTSVDLLVTIRTWGACSLSTIGTVAVAAFGSNLQVDHGRLHGAHEMARPAQGHLAPRGAEFTRTPRLQQ